MVAIALQLTMRMALRQLMLAQEIEKILEMLSALPVKHRHGALLAVMEELKSSILLLRI